MNKIANLITFSRIIFILLMFFTKNNTLIFISLYIIACFTDIADGYIARKYSLTSSFGQKFDSFADMILFGSTLYFMFYFSPEKAKNFLIPITVIFFIRIFNMVYAGFKFKKFLVYHTYLNKFTGILYGVLFPFFIIFKLSPFFVWPLIIVAFTASSEESFILFFRNIKDADYKGLLSEKNRKL
ncbi:MAG: CDP-alcohol phosphatidyltransferase family protein [Thermotogae bacterium]|nr:CDP-alcohol phosphatidyltransferase family protein [Thermotogota bacterium]HOO74394.1 CDP-alcohol phosphatidyltransferase family protein [Tepiditoga sp.]